MGEKDLAATHTTTHTKCPFPGHTEGFWGNVNILH